MIINVTTIICISIIIIISINIFRQFMYTVYRTIQSTGPAVFFPNFTAGGLENRSNVLVGAVRASFAISD